MNEMCSGTDCDRTSFARGFCLKHYKRWRNNGDPDVVRRNGGASLACLVCGIENPDGRRKYCCDEHLKMSAMAQRKQWRIDHPDRYEAARLRSQEKRRRTRHNLPPEMPWPEACNICGAATDLHVDHDHSCCPGKYSCGECVCGFLCNSCNNGLGRFKDDPDRLRAAAQYVERTRSRQPRLV
jgi:hypothetical protein